LHASPLAAVTAIDAQAEELLEGGAFSLRKFESVNDDPSLIREMFTLPQ
jgi:hypothetical protein